jgi:cytochrome oxidase assembly protein ShyY1
MRRFPLIPTLFVAGAVAVMIALGIWQLQRAQWKGRMLDELAAAQSQAPVDLDSLVAGGSAENAPIAFRRAAITCTAHEATPMLRAGRNLQGGTGYSYFLPCRPGASGFAGRVQINAGWSQQPNSSLRIDAQEKVVGTIGTAEAGGPVILTSVTAIGPLQPSAPPSIDDIPNNHLAYAFQWFFFAATATLIYVLALRRRGSVARPRRDA